MAERRCQRQCPLGRPEHVDHLPSYNPNVPALALTYNSQAADPNPIILTENPLSGSGTVPSQVSATLTFNGTAGTTYYYNTSTLNPGDIQQIGLQANASSLSTGRYDYSVQVVDHGSTLTTTTYTGTATVLNESTSSLGDGWSLQRPGADHLGQRRSHPQRGRRVEHALVRRQRRRLYQPSRRFLHLGPDPGRRRLDPHPDRWD